MTPPDETQKAYETGLAWGRVRGEITQHIVHTDMGTTHPWITETLEAALDAIENAPLHAVDRSPIINAWNKD